MKANHNQDYIESQVKQIIEDYAKSGKTIEREQALTELVNDFGGDLFGSRDGLKILDNILKDQSSKGNTGFIDTIKKWWENIKEFFGVSPYASEVEKKLADKYKSAMENKERAEKIGDDKGEYALGDGLLTFKARQERAVAQKGVVMPGLNDTEVKVVDVPRHNFTGTGNEAIASAEKWARENIVGTHSYIHDNAKLFDYEISNNSIKKYLSSTSVGNSENIGVHLAVLTKLPEVISKSIEVEEHPDYSKGADGKRSIEKPVNNKGLIHRFYGSASIDGKVYRVKTTMKEYSNASYNPKAYSYEVTKIELIEAPFTDVNNNSNQMAMTSTSSFPVSKLLQNVEKSYDKGKKLLDESRKVDERADESVLDYAKRMSEETGKKNLLNGDTGYSIKVNNKFNEDLASLTEENKDKVIFSLGHPSDVLLSADVENKPMKLYGNKVIKKMHKHGFALEQLRNLPNAVADPIAVFDNIGREGNRSILTELKTEQGNFLVTVDLGKGIEDVDFNIISSVFGKNDYKIADWIIKGFAKYINKEKALDYLHRSAPIAEALSNQRLDSATKIVENFENPKVKGENLDAEYSIKQPKDAEYEAKEQWRKDIN